MLIVTLTDAGGVVLLRDGKQFGEVTVRMRGDGRIRLGLDFPKDIKILRAELVDAGRKDGNGGKS